LWTHINATTKCSWLSHLSRALKQHREFKREVDGNTGTSAEFDGALSGYWSAAALEGHVSFATTQKK